MSNDDAEIRALIDRWAKAVHAGDMDGVLADHSFFFFFFFFFPRTS